MEYEQKSFSGDTKTLMVLLHGLGSNGDDLFSLVPYLAPKLPYTHFYAPDGIEPCDMGPFGYQWFSLQDRSPDKLVSELERVGPKITEMIKTKAEILGLSQKDVILFGFSQGTMASLYISLVADEPYKAVIGFAGRLCMPEKVANLTTPVCLVHGAEDDVLPVENIGYAKGELEKLGIGVLDLIVPNLAHSIDMMGLEFAMRFLSSQKLV
jgi:phospholipase/carboxylesterase